MSAAPCALPSALPPERSRVHLPLLTTSEVRSFLRCRRAHHYRYRLRVRPIETSAALRFGTLIHAGLEAMWRAWLEGFGGDDVLSASLDAVQAEADAFDRVKAEELLRGYYLRWRDADLEVLGVEVEFRSAITNPATGARSRTYDLGGKIDAIVRELATGRVLIVEHKTTSEDATIGSAYWRRLRLDPQVSNYLVGARAIGHEATSCLYDVLAKVSLRPYKETPDPEKRFVTDKVTKLQRLDARQHDHDETPEEFRARVRASIAEDSEGYFSRGEVVRSEEDEQDAAFDVWNVAREVRDAERGMRFPRNPAACSSFGSTCEYFDVCSRTAALDDPTRFRVACAAHEELSAARAD